MCPLRRAAKACSHDSSPARIADTNQLTAGVLALLLGGLGVHKFYLGAWGWGLVYVVLSWTWVQTGLALLEGVRYLTLREAEFQREAVLMDESISFLW